MAGAAWSGPCGGKETLAPTGRFMRWPVLDLPYTRDLLLVCGRFAAFCDDTVQLFDLDTGARLASFDVNRAFSSNIHTEAVLDRWIPFASEDGRALLLDCVAARLVEMAPANDAARDGIHFSAAGSCLSYQAYNNTTVTVVRVSGDPDGTTVVREAARVQLGNDEDDFFLCERGCSYLLHGYTNQTLQLADVATGQLKRVFSSCVYPLDTLLID